MGTLVFTILSTVGGTTIIVGILQKLLINGISEMQKHSNVKAIEEIKKTHAESLKNLDFKYQREIENHKITLKNYVRYSDEQFKLYNEFWSSLLDLKQKADDLWENANNENLFPFANQLKETKIKVEKARLFIEIDHYRNLKRILELYSEYSVGKTNLISLRRNRNIERSEINELIRSNQSAKYQYDILMEEIFASLKQQIYLPSPKMEND